MNKNINLIPFEERKEQNKVKVVKASTILTILLLIIVSAVSFYTFYISRQKKQELAVINSDIDTLRSSISDMSDREIIARNLYTKTEALNKIFSSYNNYSVLMTHIEVNTPEGIQIEELILGSENTFNLSGLAAKYNDVQDFINKLLSDDMFTKVSLNSVNLDDRSGSIRYFLVVSYVPEKLR